MREYLNCLLQKARGTNYKNRQQFEVMITSLLVSNHFAIFTVSNLEISCLFGRGGGIGANTFKSNAAKKARKLI